MNKFADICGGRYFVIPDNQRGFSWGKEQVDDVVEDLHLAGGQAHYMGPLIVSRTSTLDFQDDDLTTTAEFILEDGQQRLTTLLIFANEIRKRLNSKQAYPIHAEQLENLVYLRHQGQKLRLQNMQAALQEYLSYILTGTPAPPAERVPAMKALDEVQHRIAHHLDPLNEQELLSWKQKISNQALFVWVDLATAGVNRYLTFDAINSRGLPLSEFDKIKNFCILVCSVRAMETVGVADHWYKSLVQLQKFGTDSRSNEADFIAEMYSCYHNKQVSHRDVHASFVNTYRPLLSASDPTLEADLTHFVSLWEPYARSFGFLSCRNRTAYYGSMCSVEGGKWLDRLDNMDLPTITRPLLAASHLKFGELAFAKVARACEIYTFRVYAVIRRRKDANAAKIVELANEILRGGKDEGYVLRTICSWLKVYAPLSAVIAQLADGKAKYAFDPLITGWSHCYYFLYEYELSVSPAGVAPLPYETNRDVVKNQQEHILPQQHRDGGWWSHHWPDASLADAHKHRLGNLVLTANNQALGRKSIADKIEVPAPTHCYKHANATNSEKRIPEFTDGVTWQTGNILQREVELLIFASKRWGLSCADDNGIIQLPPDFAAIGAAPLVIDCQELVDATEQQTDNDDPDVLIDDAGSDDISI